MPRIALKLRKPHAGQQRIIADKQRFNVISCGRRFGKTIAGTNLLAEMALTGKPVAWASPSYKMLLEVWRDARTMLAPVVARNGIDTQNKRLTLVTGGVIEFWSLSAADSIRGRKYARWLIDEAAMDAALTDHWNMVIRPTLSDFRGDAFFLSTPKGRNGFYELFQRGIAGDAGWASFQMPTSTNPHIHPDELEDARRDVPEIVWLQEYLAQFLEDGAGLFRKVLQSAIAEAHDTPQPGSSYVFGVDWARSGDYTVISVIDTRTMQQVYLDRFNQVDSALQIGRLEALYTTFRPSVIVAEENSFGWPLIEALRGRGLPIQPFTTTNASKKEIIDSLALAFEGGALRILNDATQIGELMSFEQTRLKSGMYRYAAAGNGHDDTVMALALAHYAASVTPATGQTVGVWRR